MAKFIGQTGLIYLWSKIKAWVAQYVTITEADNVKTLTVGNTSATLVTKTSQLTNDSNYITISDVPEGAVASTSTPLMDGTAAVGTETAFARGDHRHPSDTTKANASELKIEAVTGYSDRKKVTLKTGTSQDFLTAHQDISGKADKSSTVSTVTYDSSGKKITKTINGTTSDVVDAATIVVDGGGITQHQDISGKANKSEMSVSTSGDQTTITLKTGTSATVINAHQDISGKADKAVPAAANNLAALDASGNLVDSGVSITEAGTDTKNTAGSTNDAAKLFIVGAKTQAANPQTYSQTNAYITAGKVYSNGKETVNLSDTQTLTNKTLESPALTGTPTAPTPAAGSNGTQVATAAFVNSVVGNYVPNSSIGAANGVAPLDSNSKIDAQYLPSYVDDVVEAYIRSGQTALSQNWLATGSATGSVITPESGKIYVLMNSDSTYAANTEFRWGGTTYVQLNDSGCTEMTNAEMDTATNNWT